MRHRQTLLRLLIRSLEKGPGKNVIQNDEIIRPYSDKGICGEMRDMYDNGVITEREFERLAALIEDSKPSKHNDLYKYTKGVFWLQSDVTNTNANTYWWDNMQVKPYTRQVRIDYLEDLLELILET